MVRNSSRNPRNPLLPSAQNVDPNSPPTPMIQTRRGSFPRGSPIPRGSVPRGAQNPEEPLSVEQSLFKALSDASDIISFLHEAIGKLTGKMTSYDVLTGDDAIVKEFLRESPENNIVFVFGEVTLIIDKTRILTDDTFYECKVDNGRWHPATDNVVDEAELIHVRKLGGNGFIRLEDIENIMDSDNNVFLMDEDRRISSVVSKSVYEGGNMVSAMHCQPGNEDTLYKMAASLRIERPLSTSIYRNRMW